ncbi:hypothetical protein DACRYDRAFT_119009 [Dacryopinax primogenitus]|uniref:Zn(2)-C6 fungal-type domain-containing protein n=1 Tax=Dacryopinax primogenitus (strain DJM 731) TaxID=1858805 RepID=M5FWI2_DACPD|nr:uncharacterized protein DACRYDRAFT_119009 [Dacryopinax primogenitus]EJT97766.1 hypothetical protein DACRYDRAFT_119009 [Dacryopinax primogenitus]
MAEDGVNGDEHRSDKRPKTSRPLARTSVACARCRQQKLRCSGGQPCQRCEKLGFARECHLPPPRANPGSRSTTARIGQLENELLNLRRAMSQQQENTLYPQGVSGPSQTQTSRSQSSNVFATPISPSSHNHIVGIPATTPSEASWPSSSSPESLQRLQQQQGMPLSAVHHGRPGEYRPSDVLSSTTINLSHGGPSNPSVTLPTSWIRGGSPSSPVMPHGTKRPLEQTEERVQAPFGDVVFNKSVFENRELSRLPSPAPQVGRRLPSNDVVEAGLLSMEMAGYYYNQFVDHCLPFIPIFADEPPPTLDSLRARSSFLATVCITLGARITSGQSEEPMFYQALADHSEGCLGATMTRKILILEDVQATLLMMGWGLRPNGQGPDAWILSGHALRMGKRLGLDSPRSGASKHSEKERERVWQLACVFDCYHTLGFGRPSPFCQRPLTPASLSPGSRSISSSDIFIACQAELASICLQLVQWADNWRATGMQPIPGNLLWSQLAPRLDDWSARWVWPSSRFVCASTHISRLYGEHVRLCLATFVLKTISRDGSGPEGPRLSTVVSAAAKAASVIVQIAIDSGNTDEAISFAPDYNILTFAQAGMAIISLARPGPDVWDGFTAGLNPVEAAEVADARPDENAATYLLKSLTVALSRRDLSRTGLATFLSKKLQAAAARAGLYLDGVRTKEPPPTRTPMTGPFHTGASYDVASQNIPQPAEIDDAAVATQMEVSTWNNALDPFFFFDPALANLWYEQPPPQ